MALRSVREVPQTMKVMMLGPSGAGKTRSAFDLPHKKKIAGYCGEDGLRPYGLEYDFGYDSFDTIPELNKKIEEDLLAPNAPAEYDLAIVDGLTVGWHEALGEVTDSAGRISMDKQKDLKQPFKDFNLLVYRLGKRGMSVWATAQSKSAWEIVKGQQPKLKGQKADVDDRVWFAFDFVGQIEVIEGVRTVTVLKSRYPRLYQAGDQIADFNAAVAFADIFNGKVSSVEDAASGVMAEIERSRDQLKRKLMAVSEKNGGPMPRAVAAEIYGIISNKASTLDEMTQCAGRIREYENQMEQERLAVPQA